MNQNWDYNYDGGGATYSRPDTGAHESKCQKNRPGMPWQPPPALPHPAPIQGRDILFSSKHTESRDGLDGLCPSHMFSLYTLSLEKSS